MPRGDGQGVGFSQLVIVSQTATRGEMGGHPHNESHKIPPVVVFIGEEVLEDVQCERVIGPVWNQV